MTLEKLVAGMTDLELQGKVAELRHALDSNEVTNQAIRKVYTRFLGLCASESNSRVLPDPVPVRARRKVRT